LDLKGDLQEISRGLTVGHTLDYPADHRLLRTRQD